MTLVYLLILVKLSLITQTFGGDNTIKVCTKDGGVHQVSSKSCSRGAWASEPLQVSCVCVKGLWLLSEKFCDKDFFIISSIENECFKIDRPIRRFLSMMNDEDLRQKSNLYFKGKLESFQTFNGNLSIPSDSVPPSGDASYFLRFNGTSTSVYLKHEEGVPKNFWQKCYKQSQDVETFQLISSSSASFISVQKNCETVRELQTGYADIKKSVWEIGMGASWHSKFGIDKTNDKCSASCGEKEVTSASTQSQGRIAKKGRFIKIKPVKGGNSSSGNPSSKQNYGIMEIDWEKSMNDGLSGNSIEVNPGDEDLLATLKEEEYDNEDLKKGVEETLSPDADVYAERLRDTGRDTIRMSNYLKKWLFHQIPGPKVAQKEFKYLQLARIIFLKSCPDADGHTLTNFFRLFRFLVYESLKKNPHAYPANTDEIIHSRILENLRTCFKKVERYNITFEPNPCEGEDDNGNGDSGIQIASIKDSKGAEYSIQMNSTKDDQIEFKTDKKSDTVLETVWKLMLHAHYQCAEEFREHPEDLSWMYVKLQEFLTSPHIMFRWENPGDYLNKVYAFMHPGFKLQRFSKTVDGCVNAAKESSVFQEWLQRPRRVRDFQTEAVKGSMALMGAESGGKPTLFNGLGYCVNKFDDPLTWTHLNEAVNAKC